MSGGRLRAAGSLLELTLPWGERLKVGRVSYEEGKVKWRWWLRRAVGIGLCPQCGDRMGMERFVLRHPRGRGWFVACQSGQHVVGKVRVFGEIVPRVGYYVKG